MFCGNFRYTISDNSRLVLPVHFRQGRKKVVIGAWPEGCLFLFSKKEWKKMMRREKGWLSLSREELRTIFSQMTELEINEKGNIKIPDDLSKQAGLEREVAIVGCGRYIEIWDRKRWESECERMIIMIKALYDGEVIVTPLKVSSN